MVVMMLDKAPQALRGELTRWLIEIKPGVYLGHINAMVRDKLWAYCLKKRKDGVVFQAWTTNNEQHFAMRMFGDSQREIVEWEGIQLIAERGEALKPAQKRRVKG